MSHSKEPIVCPNCGYHASYNYCAECGQQNHLHKETFWGLVMHFIGHYFHYDSKFWQTMKALWFSPGKLTLAYLNKQRMRYIPPVSLYIFISAVYFLLSLLLHNNTSVVKINNGKHIKEQSQISVIPKGGIAAGDSSNAKLNIYIEKKLKDLSDKHSDLNEFVREKISHDLPKIFFFMIPVMAMILKLLFIRRKEAFFVDHAIFALHYHSFWFSVFLLGNFHLPGSIKAGLYTLLFGVAVYYMVAAMRKVYNTGWFRSIANTIVLGACYSLMFGLIMFSYLLLILLLS